jgi:hypothetical protein
MLAVIIATLLLLAVADGLSAATGVARWLTTVVLFFCPRNRGGH